ncbi:hypothetical protein SAY87_013285 [Trapa incisa]|uniref:Uncharacterized protein n=1 Tax=Trapa incisa TaxID=236973 RepID=A0AAN7QCV6_9MYRT|nr:hypothetical protein SAY87_013285 [Trapa incisa]
MGLGIEGEMLQEKRPLSSSRSTVTGFSLLSGVVVIWASSKSEARNFCVYLCDSTLHKGSSARFHGGSEFIPVDAPAGNAVLNSSARFPLPRSFG